MAKYVPSPRDWVREQVELYESSGGTEGTTLRDTGLPVIIVTHIGNKTGAVRKTPLMRVKDGDSYVLVGSRTGSCAGRTSRAIRAGAGSAAGPCKYSPAHSAARSSATSVAPACMVAASTPYTLAQAERISGVKPSPRPRSSVHSSASPTIA